MSGPIVPNLAVYTAALELIAAALEIHKPCHRHATEGRADDCVRAHYDSRETPDCLGCGYDYYDQPTDYPCPTALALGVQPPEGEPHP